MKTNQSLSGKNIAGHYILFFSAVFILLFSVIVHAQKYRDICEHQKMSHGEVICSDGLQLHYRNSELDIFNREEMLSLRPVAILPLKHIWRSADVTVGLKRNDGQVIDFELHYRPGIGQMFQEIEKPCHSFRYGDENVFLNLSLLKTGLYHIRFRGDKNMEWSRWQSFLVMAENNTI
ncbi:hypothetical protein [Desulfomarina sp.]